MDYSFPAILKRRTLELIAAAKPSPLFVSVLWFVINTVTSVLVTFLTGYYDYALELNELVFSSADIAAVMDYDIIDAVMRNIRPFGVFLSLIISLLVCIIKIGFKWYCLRVARGESPDMRSLFDGFAHPFKLLWLEILKGLLTALQFCALIAPGVVAIARYSQAEYILLDHPEYGALRCLRESGGLVRGYKMAYITLALAFTGWALASFILWMFIPAPVLDIWLSIYWGITAALFHVRLRARLITNTAPTEE